MFKLRAGLYQGDISDLNVLKLEEARSKLGFTMAVNVGSTNWVPPNIYAIHLPMKDTEKYEDNDWKRILDLVDMVVREIRDGGKVLVTCDAGASRSVVFCAVVISVIDRIQMDDELKTRIIEINPMARLLLSELWNHAKSTLQMSDEATDERRHNIGDPR